MRQDDSGLEARGNRECRRSEFCHSNGAVPFTEQLSLLPTRTVSTQCWARVVSTHTTGHRWHFLCARSVPGPPRPVSTLLPSAWRGQGQRPRLGEDSTEAQSSLDPARSEPGLTLGVSCKKLTASWGHGQEGGQWEYSVASTGTQVRQRRHTARRQRGGLPWEGASGELGGPRGWKGSPGRIRRGVGEARATWFGWSLGQKGGSCWGQLWGLRGSWAVNGARLCVLGNSWGQDRVGGREEQVAALGLAELWGRGESASASRLGGCVESGDGRGGRSRSLPQPRL